ncbi:hypothetical protein KJ840_01005 [Patescibacteria group bacterium]|nr:hypothetical protein [Patescibacteria group bacterium]
MKNQRSIDIQKQILEKIKSQKVKMKSKMFFTLQKLGFKSSFGLLMALSVLIFSLTIFFIEQQASTQALGLGGQAYSAFLSDLPFSWLAFVTILVLLATLIFRKYTLAYRKPLKHSLTTLALMVILAGGLFSATGFHNGLAAKAAGYDFGFLKMVYRRALDCDINQAHILIGKVISVDKENKRAEVITRGHLPMIIQLFSDTKIIDAPRIGDVFLAVGYKEGITFYAQGVRKITLSAIKNRCLVEGKLQGN